MSTPTQPGDWRTWASGALLCFLIGMSALFYGGGLEKFYGPSASERESKKQYFLANRNRLILQLTKCNNYATMQNDAYICGGSALIYKTQADSLDCRIAAEAARELGISAESFSLTPRKPPASK